MVTEPEESNSTEHPPTVLWNLSRVLTQFALKMETLNLCEMLTRSILTKVQSVLMGINNKCLIKLQAQLLIYSFASFSKTIVAFEVNVIRNFIVYISSIHS